MVEMLQRGRHSNGLKPFDIRRIQRFFDPRQLQIYEFASRLSQAFERRESLAEIIRGNNVFDTDTTGRLLRASSLASAGDRDTIVKIFEDNGISINFSIFFDVKTAGVHSPVGLIVNRIDFDNRRFLTLVSPNGFYGAGYSAHTSHFDGRITGASDIVVLELGSILFKLAQFEILSEPSFYFKQVPSQEYQTLFSSFFSCLDTLYTVQSSGNPFGQNVAFEIALKLTEFFGSLSYELKALLEDFFVCYYFAKRFLGEHASLDDLDRVRLLLRFTAFHESSHIIQIKNSVGRPAIDLIPNHLSAEASAYLATLCFADLTLALNDIYGHRKIDSYTGLAVLCLEHALCVLFEDPNWFTLAIADHHLLRSAARSHLIRTEVYGIGEADLATLQRTAHSFDTFDFIGGQNRELVDDLKKVVRDCI